MLINSNNHTRKGLSEDKLAEFRQDYLREVAAYPGPAPTFEEYIRRRLEDQYGPSGQPTRAFG